MRQDSSTASGSTPMHPIPPETEGVLNLDVVSRPRPMRVEGDDRVSTLETRRSLHGGGVWQRNYLQSSESTASARGISKGGARASSEVKCDVGGMVIDA